MPRATPEPSDQGEVRPRGNGSRKKQRSNPTVVKIYSFCKSYKNIGPWEHNAGALPRALEGAREGLELELPLLWAVGLCLWQAGWGGGWWLRASATCSSSTRAFPENATTSSALESFLPSCPRKLFLSAPGLFSGWGRGGRWTTPVLQMC